MEKQHNSNKHLLIWQENTPSKQIEAISRLSIRATSLSQLWDSDEPAFALIKKETSESTLRMLLLVEVNKMAELINANLSKPQIHYLVDFIITDYWNYTISDFTIIVKKIMSEKQFGQPNLSTIIQMFQTYSVEREQYAVQEYSKNKNKSIDKLENDKIKSIYATMIEKGSELNKLIDAKNKAIEEEKVRKEEIKQASKEFQDEKMKIAKARNLERIKQLQKEHPDVTDEINE